MPHAWLEVKRDDKRTKTTYASVKLRVTVGSTLTPGPIEEETTTDLTYLPLAEDGLTRSSSVKSAP